MFKFVLDYKIKELKAQIDPKNDDIAEMRQQIKAMDFELEECQLLAVSFAVICTSEVQLC